MEPLICNGQTIAAAACNMLSNYLQGKEPKQDQQCHARQPANLSQAGRHEVLVSDGDGGHPHDTPIPQASP